MSLGARELLILLLIVIVLFGARKLPELARSMGRSMRIFKAETKGLDDEESAESSPEGSASGRHQGSAPEAGRRDEQEPDYPELPVSYHVVEETGETPRRSQSD
jgi:sec-independent protein translocase protein TatA